MVMPRAGTFDYVATVPQRIDGGQFECQAEVRTPAVTTGNHLVDARLVGLRPRLQVVDAGLTPDPGPTRPWVLRSRLTLIATDDGAACVAEASFHVDKALMSRLMPGDALHLARTARGGLALSAIRGGRLVFAAGAIANVSLGDDVEARIPMESILEAAGVFARKDPEFEFPIYPIEFCIDGMHTILFEGRRTIGEYHVSVEHGSIKGMPGTDECGAIARQGLCSHEVAALSALLLSGEGALSMRRR